MKTIRRALISVSDKTGLIPFAKFLADQKVEILSTGGTLKALKEAGVEAIPVEDFTGFPEILEGRVKTLHPKIHGGLLYRRDKKSHASEARKHGIEPIDLLVVNLYPFEKVTSQASVDFETAIENIDIGGPSMLRSAAKNFEAVTVVCDPSDYSTVTEEIKKHQGSVSEALRRKLANKVFERTSAYDAAISAFLENGGANVGADATKVGTVGAIHKLPLQLNLGYAKLWDLRYGENPHQKAAFYISKNQKGPLFQKLHGKELSFNNLLDVEAAVDVMREFTGSADEQSAACVIKHNNPCGIAEGEDVADALERAIECDTMSAFGGILAINRPCDKKTAQAALDRLKFFEIFVAPNFEPKALEMLKVRQNLRLIETGTADEIYPYDLKFLQKGLLLQERDLSLNKNLKNFKKNLRFVTETKLEGAEIDDLIFAFKCVKIVKSNAIVITQGRQTVGIGAGQMSRVDSVEIACSKAGYRTEGGFLASDAFFPMPDSIEVAHEKKIRAIIQPGGSVRDQDVIDACNRFGIAMAFTGERHFRH